MAETSEKKYHVYDRKTGERANRTEYSSRSAASKAVDRLDNEYGGYRYSAKPVETPGASRSGGPGRGGSGIAGGGGMNPTDIEKVPGKRPLKFSIGGVVKKVAPKKVAVKKPVVKKITPKKK